MAAASSASFGDADEWEICNDNGLVYKRRRRRRHPESPVPAAPDNPEAELRRHRRARKKRCLLALRDKYLAELAQWETLSSSLLTSPPLPPPPAAVAAVPAAPKPSSQIPKWHPLVDDLLSQAEAQELMVQKLAQTCEYVESACEERERRLAQSILDLPIWGSPRSLIASLSD
ncbi:hypothetical protein DsansV1_C18g0154491 [Dioscorea sansibarensis]